MAKTKVFQSGNSQAIRIPKEFQLHCKNVEIFRQGSDLIIREKPQNLALAFDSLAKLSSDFLSSGRKQPKPQKRADF